MQNSPPFLKTIFFNGWESHILLALKISATVLSDKEGGKKKILCFWGYIITGGASISVKNLFLDLLWIVKSTALKAHLSSECNLTCSSHPQRAFWTLQKPHVFMPLKGIRKAREALWGSTPFKGRECSFPFTLAQCFNWVCSPNLQLDKHKPQHKSYVDLECHNRAVRHFCPTPMGLGQCTCIHQPPYTTPEKYARWVTPA